MVVRRIASKELLGQAGHIFRIVHQMNGTMVEVAEAASGKAVLECWRVWYEYREPVKDKKRCRVAESYTEYAR